MHFYFFVAIYYSEEQKVRCPMDIQKQVIRVYPFAYHKIIGGQRKIDIRPYVPTLHNLKVGDMIEYVNVETNTSVMREIKGIATFSDFDTLIKMLSPELIGYDTREEVKLRVERMYSPSEQAENGVCALFIDEPNVKRMMKLSSLARVA